MADKVKGPVVQHLLPLVTGDMVFMIGRSFSTSLSGLILRINPSASIVNLDGEVSRPKLI